MKKITIIEAPSNLGLVEPFPGVEPGVKKLPAWLKKHGFYELWSPSEIIRTDPPAYSMLIDEACGIRNADSIVLFSKQLSVIVCNTLRRDYFPLVIGGDCSILIGCALALKAIGKFGLFFLDGHTDFIWSSLSNTAGAAGMDLAIVCGYGGNKLTDIENKKPYFKEEFVWCVGNRKYTDWYVEAIRNSKIHYFDLDNLRKVGIKKCVVDFLNFVEEEKLDGFWIHFDVDVLHDDLMPIVDSRQPDGLSYEDLYQLLCPLLTHKKASGLDLTILDPDRDKGGIYTKAFIRNFRKVMNAVHKGECLNKYN
jgi:arginase